MVNEVRQQAERTIALANLRIGEELAAQPVAKGAQGNPGGRGAKIVQPAEGAAQPPTLAQQVGSKNEGLRLKRLAASGRPAVIILSANNERRPVRPRSGSWPALLPIPRPRRVDRARQRLGQPRRPYPDLDAAAVVNPV